MNDMNVFICSGRATGNFLPEQLSNGTSFIRFTIANNKGYMRNDEWVDHVNFFDCSLFGKSVERFKDGIKKGQFFYIEGSLKQNRVTLENGNSRSYYSLIVDRAYPYDLIPFGYEAVKKPLDMSTKKEVELDIPEDFKEMPF